MEEPISFPAGSNSLEGLLSLPSPLPAIGVVVCHPHPLYGGDMHNNVVVALVEALQQAGHATLRFNFRGVGRSGGAHDNGIGERDDVRAAVGVLAEKGFGTVVVAGYSFGAFVGLGAGAQMDNVSKLIGVALPVASRDASFLNGVTKPTLLVAGDRDDRAPLEKLRPLAQGTPSRSLVVVDGADHFFRGEERVVAQAVVLFLSR